MAPVTTSSSFPSDTETDVLICGAGPTGLATALSILHHRPSTRLTIVDALPKGQSESRALVVHARTLEALDSVNAATSVTNAGLKSNHVFVQSPTSVLLKSDFPALAPWTKFPYMVLLPQNHTQAVLERLLTERGVDVVRPLRASAFKELDGEGFEVTFEGGERIKTKYLVGADGGRSAVRTFSGIPFKDPPPANFIARLTSTSSEKAQLFVVADVKFVSPLPEGIEGKLYTTIGTQGFTLFVPLLEHLPSDSKGKERSFIYRIAFYVSPEDKHFANDIKTDTSHSFLQRVIEAGVRFPCPSSTRPEMKVKEVVWTNTFHIRYAVADAFFKNYSSGGTVILVGDAAHIHSPVGGQGMNMGICNAVDAGSAIASHLTSPSSSQVFEEYSTRHREIALQTIAQTKMASFMFTIRNPVIVWVRGWIAWIAGRFGGARRGAAWNVSGLMFR